ncbi:phage tail protein, partial [Pseudomonas sp. MAFF 302030]
AAGSARSHSTMQTATWRGGQLRTELQALLAGTGKTQIIRMNFIVANTAQIVLKIDPAVVLATREYVDNAVIEALAKLDFKHSALVATTANIVLSGLLTSTGCCCRPMPGCW